jgi:hypothetical protein
VRCAELEAALARQEALHRTQISALRANTSAARYNEGRDRAALLKRLEDEILRLNNQPAQREQGGLADASHNSDACAFMRQQLSGKDMMYIMLSSVGRTDIEQQIDLFDLAVSGRKTGTIRAGCVCKYVHGQFVYLKGRGSAHMRLVKITGVGQPESWGSICLCPLRKGQVIAVEGLGDHPPPPGICVSTADYWCTQLSRWLAGFYPEKSEDEPLTGDRVLKSATDVYMIRWTLVG